MPATPSPIDPALLRSIKAGDERALERLFRARYDALVAEATALLDGDGAAAGKGVEGVFEQLWASREEVGEPADLDAYLHNAVHAAAVRLKGRHATAQHFGDLSAPGARATHRTTPRPPPAADDAWAKVQRAIHAPAEHSANAARKVVDHSRHEVASALGEMSKPRSRGPMIALGVGAVLLGAGLVWWMGGARDSAALSAGLSAPNVRTVNTVAGQLGDITLRDASVVKLGPESKLRIPSAFGEMVRGLELDGTALFTVAPGHKDRFTVVAGKVTVVAEGTAFTVRAYSGEPFVTVRVREGTVEVRSGKSTVSLAAGAAVAVATDGTTREPSVAEAEEAVGWADGIVVATDKPLRDVLLVAQRWYGMQFLVPDTSLLDRKVTLRAALESAEEARKSIELSGGLKRQWEGTNMVLTDQFARPLRR